MEKTIKNFIEFLGKLSDEELKNFFRVENDKLVFSCWRGGTCSLFFKKIKNDYFLIRCVDGIDGFERVRIGSNLKSHSYYKLYEKIKNL